jgi:hypothetical protein
MTLDQAIQIGEIQAQARLKVIEAAEGKDAAAEYAKGMATYARDYMLKHCGQKHTAFWFMCLGQDAVTSPEGA